jgi:hypothetical protein
VPAHTCLYCHPFPMNDAAGTYAALAASSQLNMLSLISSGGNNGPLASAPDITTGQVLFCRPWVTRKRVDARRTAAPPSDRRAHSKMPVTGATEGADRTCARVWGERVSAAGWCWAWRDMSTETCEVLQFACRFGVRENMRGGEGRPWRVVRG